MHTDNGAIDIKETNGSLDVETSNGEIALEHLSVTDRLHAVSSNGSVICTDIRAAASALDVNLSSSNGRIEYAGDASQVSLTTMNGAISWKPTTQLPLSTGTLKTSNSGIAIDLPSAFSAHIDAQTVNGTIQASGIAAERAAEDGTSASYKLGDGTGKVELETSNGSITLDRTSEP